MALCGNGIITVLNNQTAQCSLSVVATPSAENAGQFNVTVVGSWTALPAGANEIYFAVKDQSGNLVGEHQTAITGTTTQSYTFTLAAPVAAAAWTAEVSLVQN